MRFFIVASPESVLAILAFALVAFGYGSTGPIGAAAALLGAALCICVLPGYFLAGAIAEVMPAAWPQRWMMAVGFSLFLIECACVIALTLHVSLHHMSLGIATVLVAITIFRLRWPGRTEIDLDARGRNLRLIAIAAWLFCAAAAYAIGNLSSVDPGENLLNIGIADALRTALRPQDAFYLHGVYPIYPFPGLNYAYALVAELSGLPTVFVFEKMRFLWTLTAMAAVFVGVRALSGVVPYAYLALLGVALLALTGPFGPVSGFYWGQLATTSHNVDVEMNVIVPIALSSLFVMLSPLEHARREPPILFACMALLLSAIHQRELVQLLVYAGCALLVLRGRKPSIALGLAMIAATCSAIAYRGWAAAYAPGAGDVLATSKAELLNELWKLDIRTGFRPLANWVIFYDFSFLWGLNGLMLVATGIALVQNRSLPAIRTCGLAVAGFGVAESFAVLTILILWATYDELFYTPVRHIIFVLYCCSSIAFAALLSSITTHANFRRPGAATIVAVASAAALAVAARLLQTGFVPAELLVIAVSICGVVTLVPRRKHAEGTPPVLPLIPSLGALGSFAIFTFMPASALLTALVAEPTGFTPRAVLRIEYESYVRIQLARENQCHAAKVSLLGREIEFQSCTPPFGVVDWLHENVPQDGVLLLNPLGGFGSTGLVPVRVAVPPRFVFYRNWEKAFPRVRQVIGCSLDRFGGMPFFASGETPEQRYADARALDATLVLADPSAHGVALTAARARPDLFGVLMDQSEWVLLAIKSNSPASDTPSCPTQ